MHGGAKGSGAPKGNKNALKTGEFTRERIAERKAFRSMFDDMKKTLDEFE